MKTSAARTQTPPVARKLKRGKDVPRRKTPAKTQQKNSSRSASRAPLKICILTRQLHGWDEPNEAMAATVGLAQYFAAQGDAVTLLWVPPFESVDDTRAYKLTQYFFNNHLITLEILKSSPHMLPILWGAEKSSAAVYYHLKEQSFDAVYFALEGGLGYYTILAKELGLFEPRPRLHVLTNAPIAWQAAADRHFLEDLAQVTIAHMERYCAEQADNLICSSSYLLGWMKQERWNVAKDVSILPALRPFEWKLLSDAVAIRDPDEPVDELVFLPAPISTEDSPFSVMRWTRSPRNTPDASLSRSWAALAESLASIRVEWSCVARDGGRSISRSCRASPISRSSHISRVGVAWLWQPICPPTRRSTSPHAWKKAFPSSPRMSAASPR